jgi:hypothetical protein
MTTENKIEDAEYPLFCVNCKFHSFEEIERKGIYKITHYCAHPKLVDMVTGQNSIADANRLNAKLCGRKALFFSPKPGFNK